jgi:hypothetical protein
MGDSFTAMPEVISELGTQFQGQGDELLDNASAFGDDAFQIGEAFGLLGVCDGALEKYVSMLNNTVSGLNQLAEVWQQTGAQLLETAGQYASVDEAQAQNLARIGGGK